MADNSSDRRHFQRLHFEESIAGQFGSSEVEILDLSLQGARVLETQPTHPGRRADLRFRWLDRVIAIPSEVVRCKFERQSGGGRANLYGCGLRYVEPDGAGARQLREIISEQVLRALEEQIANARGSFIPLADRMTIFRSLDILTTRPPSLQRHRIPGFERAYVSCALTERGWRTMASSESAQPGEGFTVLALEDPKHVELLCATYQKSDAQTRRMIRMLAELSLEEAAGPGI